MPNNINYKDYYHDSDKSSTKARIHHQQYAEETIELINNLEKNNQKIAIDNLRYLYRETSSYSLHYSNIRSALAVLFIGGSIAFLPHLYDKDIPDITSRIVLTSLEIVFLFIGFFAHITLTRNAQSALMRLVAIERILSSVIFNLKSGSEVKEEEENETKKQIFERRPAIEYFTYWAKGLGQSEEPTKKESSQKEPFCASTFKKKLNDARTLTFKWLSGAIEVLLFHRANRYFRDKYKWLPDVINEGFTRLYAIAILCIFIVAFISPFLSKTDQNPTSNSNNQQASLSVSSKNSKK